MGTVVDRIRGWADDGLLQVSGDKHPGTGRKRLYAPGAIIDASVLTALTDAGLAAVRAGYFQDAKGKGLLGFGRMGASDVLDPNQTEQKTPFLVIYGQTPGDIHIALAHADTPLLARSAQHARWLIILNLADIFRPLRGIVTAVNEHGLVKIELAKTKT